jgi:hypothetical protein
MDRQMIAYQLHSSDPEIYPKFAEELKTRGFIRANSGGPINFFFDGGDPKTLFDAAIDAVGTPPYNLYVLPVRGKDPTEVISYSNYYGLPDDGGALARRVAAAYRRALPDVSIFGAWLPVP